LMWEPPPQSIAFDGKFLWVANQGSNNVSKILRGI